MKEISSSLTFLYKYVAIVLWVGGFALGTREVLLAGPGDPRWIKYFIVWILVALFILLATANIKKVTLEGKQLVISNFVRTETIDTSMVESVDGSTYLSPKLVWFTLKEPSAFGSRITFIPRRRMTPGIGKHPLVHELTEELGLEQ